MKIRRGEAERTDGFPLHHLALPLLQRNFLDREVVVSLRELLPEQIVLGGAEEEAAGPTQPGHVGDGKAS